MTATKGSERFGLLMPPRGLHERHYFGQRESAIVRYPGYELVGGLLGVARQRFNQAISHRAKQHYLRMSAVYEWAHFLEIPFDTRAIAHAAEKARTSLTPSLTHFKGFPFA
jgi:hypothetical protein